MAALLALLAFAVVAVGLAVIGGREEGVTVATMAPEPATVPSVAPPPVGPVGPGQPPSVPRTEPPGDAPAPGSSADSQVAALPTAPLPWKRNSVPAPVEEDAPRIVIVIDDMGLDRRRSDRVVELPGPLTLAWLPYARNLTEQSRAAQAAGHELIVHVPMQPDGDADPGPNAMLTGLPPEELQRRLAINLSAFDGYVGINNHMGSRFTADEPGMSIVLQELDRRGLLFLDSRTTAASVAKPVAGRLRVPFAERDVFLDHQQTPEFLAAALAKVEETAKRDGLAIAIGHPHDVTAEALERWLPTLADKGFQLIPLSAAVEVQRPGS